MNPTRLTAASKNYDDISMEKKSAPTIEVLAKRTKTAPSKIASLEFPKLKASHRELLPAPLQPIKEPSNGPQITLPLFHHPLAQLRLQIWETACNVSRIVEFVELAPK
jgi:hypothetical protein